MSRSKTTRKKRGAGGKLLGAGLGLRLDRAAVVLGETFFWLLLISVWWFHDPEAKDAFRLPKQVLSQGLALASICALCWRLRGASLGLGQIKRCQVVRALVPLLLVASLGLVFSRYPLHLQDALTSLAIGSLALVVWSCWLPVETLNRLVGGIVVPGVASALVGISQFHGIWRPFDFAGELESQRLGVTSFAGSAGDLAVFLVLPCLIAQQRWVVSTGRRRWGWAAALAICLYALAVTQTLSALVALIVGSLVFWLIFASTKRVLAVATGLGLAASLLILVLAPLRARVVSKVQYLAKGKIDEVLTGRLDGWKGAWWMLSENPLTGVGLGGYRAEFATAKMALVDQGVEFFRGQHQVMFVNAHNEFLEVAAELGWPGLVALAWALWVLFQVLRNRTSRIQGKDAPALELQPRSRADSALAWSGVTGLAVCSLAQFPFRLAMVAFPAILFLAWVFARQSSEEPS
ncbi:MAG: O-antigen ligase family protein [Deltaproteobacteria bacterium]|nr:O-antigen ligase family protein [Deltaproteobacteria bacterium]